MLQHIVTDLTILGNILFKASACTTSEPPIPSKPFSTAILHLVVHSAPLVSKALSSPAGSQASLISVLLVFLQQFKRLYIHYKAISFKSSTSPCTSCDMDLLAKLTPHNALCRSLARMIPCSLQALVYHLHPLHYLQLPHLCPRKSLRLQRSQPHLPKRRMTTKKGTHKGLMPHLFSKGVMCCISPKLLYATL